MKENADLQDCKDDCDRLASCLGFSFNFKKKACWLKDVIKENTKFTYRPHSMFYKKDLTCK